MRGKSVTVLEVTVVEVLVKLEVGGLELEVRSSRRASRDAVGVATEEHLVIYIVVFRDILMTQHHVRLDSKSVASLCHSKRPPVEGGAGHMLAT